MKFKLLLAMILTVGLLAACVAEETEPEEEEADVVASASFAEDAESFIEAASADGTWIVIPTKDLTIEEEVVVAGTFYGGKDAEDEDAEIYRKIAAYTQDDDRNIIDQWTITVPQLTIQSENTIFYGGTLAGDVYVEVDGFALQEDATIEGNLTFASEDYQASAEINGTVNGDTVVE